MLKMHACIANLEMKKEDVEKVQTGRVREFAVVERERERRWDHKHAANILSILSILSTVWLQKILLVSSKTDKIKKSQSNKSRDASKKKTKAFTLESCCYCFCFMGLF